MTALKNLPYQLPLHSCHIFNLHIHTLLSVHTHMHLSCICVAPACLSVSFVRVHWATTYTASEAAIIWELERKKKKKICQVCWTRQNVEFHFVPCPRRSNKVRKLATLYLQRKTWESVFASRKVCSYCKKWNEKFFEFRKKKIQRTMSCCTFTFCY